MMQRQAGQDDKKDEKEDGAHDQEGKMPRPPFELRLWRWREEARDETRQEEHDYEWIGHKGKHVPHAMAPSGRHRFVGSAGEQAFLRLGLRQAVL